jgi:hypothetical protein
MIRGRPEGLLNVASRYSSHRVSSVMHTTTTCQIFLDGYHKKSYYETRWYVLLIAKVP